MINANGAGDAFVAALACGIVHGIPLERSIRLGLAAGAITVAAPATVARGLSLEVLLKGNPQ